MARGTLRIYLGAAPGVGKTFAMLGEGRRRFDRGTDVVVGYVETHRRPKTAAQVEGLEVVPRRQLEYRGATFEEMDVDAILARKPAVALVDELAHTNVPGSPREKRWQDVDVLLDAGITVVSTLNIQHLESVNDVVEQITGVKQRETIPDAVVRRADQIELVDMAPEAIRRRMAHGNIYPAERVDAALGNYFRTGNLGALRELALLWVADRVDDALQDYRDRHGIDRPWETRERVVVALTGTPDGERLVRRAARMAARSKGDLIAVHVRPQDGLASAAADLLEEQRELVEELGGAYREVVGADIGEALVSTAHALNATQIVLGATRRSRFTELTRGSVINRVIADSGVGLDVHVISRADDGSEATSTRRRRRPSALPRRRILLGFALAAVALPVLTWVLTNLREHLGLPSVLLLFLLLVVAVSAVGGVWPALAAAVCGFLLVNWYFTPPTHTFTIAEGENLLALSVFLAVAAVVSAFVSLAARRAADGARDRAEAEALAQLAGTRPVGRPAGQPAAAARARRRRRLPPHCGRVGPRALRRPCSRVGVAGGRERRRPRRAPPAPDGRRARHHELRQPHPGRVRAGNRSLARDRRAQARGVDRREPRRGRRAAHSDPLCRLARPPHAALGHQGVGDEPAPGGRGLDARGGT